MGVGCRQARRHLGTKFWGHRRQVTPGVVGADADETRFVVAKEALGLLFAALFFFVGIERVDVGEAHGLLDRAQLRLGLLGGSGGGTADGLTDISHGVAKARQASLEKALFRHRIAPSVAVKECLASIAR